MILYDYISNLTQNKLRVVSKEQLADIKNEIGNEKLIEVPKNLEEDFFVFKLDESNYLLISVKSYEKIISQNNEKDIYIHQLNKILDRYEQELFQKREDKVKYDDKLNKFCFISIFGSILLVLVIGILIGKFLLN